jgi:hypothetical protein
MERFQESISASRIAMIPLEIGLDHMMKSSGMHGPSFNPQITLKGCYFADGNLDRLPPDTQEFIRRAALAVDLNRLPDVQAITRTAT